MITDIQSIHEKWMSEAIRLAEIAYEKDEIPVGAIVIRDNKIIGRGYNQREILKDPTAHAEVLAITAAANTIDDWRLDDCTLYVTKEPCAMCAGAIINSRINTVIFGCYDVVRGYCGSIADLCGDPRLKNDITVRGGISEERCLALIQDFFKTKRKS